MSEANEIGATGDVMLDAQAAAQFTGLAVGTLAKLRCLGGSAPYIKAGRKILYPRSGLVRWLNARMVRNTAQGLSMPRRLTDDLLPPSK
jgi:hypothetical protein